MRSNSLARLPVIRHFRYWFYKQRVVRWAQHWGNLGVGIGLPNKADIKTLEAIWKGQA